MRILIAIGVPRQKEAGAAGVVLNHARELETLGHEVECWFLDDILETTGKAKRFDALRFSLAIAKRIRSDPSRFDVVNLHAPWGCAYGWQRAWNSGKGWPPYVLTMQGSEERFVEAMKLENQKGRAANFGWKNRAWHRLFHQTMYDISIRTANYGAVANREAWVLAELKYGKKPGEFVFIPNGTEERFFCQREYADTSTSSVLYVGTWIDRKGTFYLAEAFEILAEKYAGIVLTVAGSGIPEEEVRKSFVPQWRERVTVIPFISREQIPNLYASHDIFAFPSLVEGMPLTLLEAMASGMPVVTTNSSGMADVVEDEFNGLLVEPANSRELARAIAELCESRELREKLGLQGQNTARRYTWTGVVRKLENLLLRAAGDGSRRTPR